MPVHLQYLLLRTLQPRPRNTLNDWVRFCGDYTLPALTGISHKYIFYKKKCQPYPLGMQRSRAWCGTPPILGVVNMVGTRNFTCYMGAL